MNYIWDAEKRQYVDQDGKPVPESKLRQWINETIANLALLFISRSKKVQDVVAQDITQLNNALTTWNEENRRDIYALHYAMTAVAFGGVQNITFDQWNEAETAINTQLSFWDNFVVGVLTGAVAINNNFPIRASLYALAGFSTYQNSVVTRELFAGMTQYKNNLGASDHCVDCVSETAKGWVNIGSLIPIGSRVCKVRCRCWFSFRKEQTI